MAQGGRPQVQPELLQQAIVKRTIDFENQIKSFGEYINDFPEMHHEE